MRDPIPEQRLREILKREVEYVGGRERRFDYLIAALCCVGLALAALYAYGAL